MQAIETFEHAGFTVEIHPDDSPTSPREWDNLGVMVGWARNSTIGDVRPREDREDWIRDLAHEVSGTDADDLSVEEAEAIVDAHTVITRLYLRGSDVGWIYAPRDKILKEYSATEITPEIRANVEACFKGEMETYEQWAEGDVYGFIVRDADGEQVESCWGFYGFDDVREEAKSAAEGERDYRAKEAAKRAHLVGMITGETRVE